jgi:hypothetical protein
MGAKCVGCLTPLMSDRAADFKHASDFTSTVLELAVCDLHF